MFGTQLHSRSPSEPLASSQSEFRNMTFNLSAAQSRNNLQDQINVQLFDIAKFKMNGFRVGQWIK